MDEHDQVACFSPERNADGLEPRHGWLMNEKRYCQSPSHIRLHPNISKAIRINPNPKSVRGLAQVSRFLSVDVKSIPKLQMHMACGMCLSGGFGFPGVHRFVSAFEGIGAISFQLNSNPEFQCIVHGEFFVIELGRQSQRHARSRHSLKVVATRKFMNTTACSSDAVPAACVGGWDQKKT